DRRVGDGRVARDAPLARGAHAGEDTLPACRGVPLLHARERRSLPRAAFQAGERAGCGKRRGAGVASISHLPAPRIRCATRQSDWPMKPDTLNLYGALTFPHIKRVALIGALDRKSTRLNSSHLVISYAVF